MSDEAAERGQLDPSAVLAEAIARLTAGGHTDLAAAVQRVNDYLGDLAAAHTEIAQASDRVLERGEAMLSTPAPDGAPAPDAWPVDPEVRERKGRSHPRPRRDPA